MPQFYRCIVGGSNLTPHPPQVRRWNSATWVTTYMTVYHFLLVLNKSLSNLATSLILRCSLTRQIFNNRSQSRTEKTMEEPITSGVRGRVKTKRHFINRVWISYSGTTQYKYKIELWFLAFIFTVWILRNKN